LSCIHHGGDFFDRGWKAMGGRRAWQKVCKISGTDCGVLFGLAGAFPFLSSKQENDEDIHESSSKQACDGTFEIKWSERKRIIFCSALIPLASLN